jgi:hypothetical protein
MIRQIVQPRPISLSLFVFTDTEKPLDLIDVDMPAAGDLRRTNGSEQALLSEPSRIKIIHSRGGFQAQVFFARLCHLPAPFVMPSLIKAA